MNREIMFERFTPAARNVVRMAQDDVRARRHWSLRLEHLLVQVAGSGLTPYLDAEFNAKAVDAVEKLCIGLDVFGDVRDIPYTVGVKRVLERSLREALLLWHNMIGVNHILVAIARVTGDASSTLHGVSTDELITRGRQEALVEMAEPSSKPPPATGKFKPEPATLTYAQLGDLLDLHRRYRDEMIAFWGSTEVGRQKLHEWIDEGYGR